MCPRRKKVFHARHAQWRGSTQTREEVEEFFASDDDPEDLEVRYALAEPPRRRRAARGVFVVTRCGRPAAYRK
jgi:hypothetical protein